MAAAGAATAAAVAAMVAAVIDTADGGGVAAGARHGYADESTCYAAVNCKNALVEWMALHLICE